MHKVSKQRCHDCALAGMVIVCFEQLCRARFSTYQNTLQSLDLQDVVPRLFCHGNPSILSLRFKVRPPVTVRTPSRACICTVQTQCR